MSNYIEQLSTEYYDVVYTLTNRDDGLWIGEALIKRKDTGEEVPGGLSKSGLNRNEIENNIFSHIKELSSFLSKEPDDWNTKVREILARCKDLKRNVIEISLRIENSIEKGNKNTALVDNFFEFYNKSISTTIWLIKEIDKLSSIDRKKLLRSKDEVYFNIMDPWNIDEISVRDEIFKYFIDPTEGEVVEHNLHLKKIKDANESFEIKEKLKE